MTTRTVLITGAGRGIGEALARHCAGAGHVVIAGCRSPETATALAQVSGVELVRVDLRSPFDLGALAETLEARAVDVLINNAGTMGEGWERQALGGAQTDAAWLEAFETNAIGP